MKWENCLVFFMMIAIVCSCGSGGVSDSGSDQVSYDLADKGDGDDEIVVPASYQGMITTNIYYVDVKTGKEFWSADYEDEATIKLTPSAAIPNSGQKETNPFNILIASNPFGGLYDYYGQVYLSSAVVTTPAATPNVTPDILFQFWTISENGNEISGTVINSYSNYISTPFANYIKIQGAYVPSIVGQQLEVGSTMSGTVTSGKASFVIEGRLVPTDPSYYCFFRCEVHGSPIH